MQATDASTLFQSDGALALGQARSSKALRTATGPEWGSPIWLGQRYKDSAGLAEAGAAADGGSARVLSLRCREGSIWTSESGGVLRRLDAETGRVESVLRGHTAPVPSFTFLRDGTVVSGSWDRSLRFWRADKQVAVVPDAGSDFIKAVHAFTLAGREYLLSGGSDKMLRCWDVTDALTPELVATMREHTRPINCLGSLVLSEDRTVLFSADSMGRVLQLELDTAARRFKVTRELRAHETSVYDLRALWVEEELDGDPTQTPIEPAGEFLSPPYEAEDGSFRRRVGQVWTCSADKTARLFRLCSTHEGVRSSKAGAALGTAPPLGAHLTLAHDASVKTVCALPRTRVVVTGAADEHIRVFSADDGALLATVEGHWHEVEAADAWVRQGSGPLGQTETEGTEEEWLVTSGLDGSVRRWKGTDIIVPRTPAPAAAVEAEQEESSGPGLMTAEEEAELAELMGSDDDDM